MSSIQTKAAEVMDQVKEIANNVLAEPTAAGAIVPLDHADPFVGSEIKKRIMKSI